jgi:hypothetical protein
MFLSFDKDSAFIFTTCRLTSTLLETGVDANDCKCSRDLLNVPSEGTRDNKFLVTHPMTDLYE